MTQPVTDQQHTRTDLEQINGTPVILNLGCGTDDRGVGVDIHYDPDIHHNLNQGIPVADDAVDAIVAEHVLEHLDDPSAFFTEAARVLRAGGTLELEVPNSAWIPVRLWITQDPQRFWSHKDPGRDGHWLARRLGNTDDRRTAHRTLWTKQLLSEYLERHGFEYEIAGWHGARNLSVTATRGPPATEQGRTLHEMERSAGGDLASNDYWAQTRARILGKWVKEQDPDTILDAGCGSGYLTAVLAHEVDADVHGVDISEESISVAKERHTSATFAVEDITEIGEWGEQYDAILFADVLEHFERPGRVVVPAREVLSNDGSMYVSMPAHQWLWGPHDEHNEHHRRYSQQDVKHLAVECNLRVERSRYTNAVPLVPYLIYQRVLKRAVPGGARGGHNRAVEALKRVLISAEERFEPPVGVTVMGELRKR